MQETEFTKAVGTALETRPLTGAAVERTSWDGRAVTEGPRGRRAIWAGQETQEASTIKTDLLELPRIRIGTEVSAVELFTGDSAAPADRLHAELLARLTAVVSAAASAAVPADATTKVAVFGSPRIAVDNDAVVLTIDVAILLDAGTLVVPYPAAV